MLNGPSPSLPSTLKIRHSTFKIRFCSHSIHSTPMLPIVIAGPTGTGKSELALRIAEAIGGAIVNYDSIQIYRGFDIGSAKPSAEARQRVPHHLFDIIDADAEFNAAD